MAASGELQRTSERIVIAVSNNAACKDAIKWAMANKVRKADNSVLVFLHVVTRIPSPMGMEMYQSEVNNTMFVHYVRTIVQPMMLQLKKLVDNRVKLELKVGRNNSKEKGIVEEAKKLKATTLVIGSSSRTMFGMRGKTTSTGAYCVRAKPSGISVFVIQKDKVVLSVEADSSSPSDSASTSPSSSGRMLGGSGELDDDSAPQSRLASERLMPTHFPLSVDSSEFNRGYSMPLAQSEANSGSLPTLPHNRGVNPASRLQASRAAKYGTWNGAGENYSDSAGLPPSGLGAVGSPGEGHLGSISTSFSGSSVGWSSPSKEDGGSPGMSGHAGEEAMQALGIDMPQLPADIANWTATERDAHHKEQLEYMKGLEGRLSKARAALQAYPASELDLKLPKARSSSLSNAGTDMDSPHEDDVDADAQAAEEDEAALADLTGAGGNGVESALLKELMAMRRKAAEAERARLEAEKRAEQLMTAADLSLREVEAQSKKRELENAALIERATLQATRAMASAEEARKKALVEAQKTEQALTQALITQSALDQEARKRAEAEAKAKKEPAVRKTMARTGYREYTWEEIMAATDNFRADKKLGEGGFGTVFAGTLHHTPVAVKILKNTDALQAASEFQQEVEVLGQIQHPHMVMLLGCCPEKYCLVYEYMANGSLEDRLACLNGSPPLPWYARMRIAAEVASALLILHSRPIPIVHRDLKPANILLDKNLVAKLGDVGLARLMPDLNDNQTYMRDSTPVGTFAYVDPEFQRTGEFGPKSDVYALGIVLLDLLTGRTPSSYEHLEESVEDGNKQKFVTFLDKTAGKWPVDLAMEVAQIAVRCSEMRRKKRPDLETEVMPQMEKVRDIAAKAEQDFMNRSSGGGFMDAPSSLFCPITQEIMVNPVLASDGHTYEEQAITQWLEKNDRSPMTNAELKNKDLVPNHAVKSMIREWHERSGR
eukprot:TRINITY_DN14_c0_g1_i1.p1 TRINITY_DN14_c0_g1~~TRINITY_DN14_c0_g1_i1.p1  ORF type:complete len:972 (-),score=181.63 TRINITY_DN14_c0_g1_i1:2662-5499(-)